MPVSTRIAHSESKNCATVHNFDKCRPVFEILSLLYSTRNLQQNLCHISYHILAVWLHYLAKYKRPKLAKFCCIFSI